jgi:hypothetical protein
LERRLQLVMPGNLNNPLHLFSDSGVRFLE